MLSLIMLTQGLILLIYHDSILALESFAANSMQVLLLFYYSMIFKCEGTTAGSSFSLAYSSYFSLHLKNSSTSENKFCVFRGL